MVDIFAGKATDISGRVDCELTYLPKDINEILMPLHLGGAGCPRRASPVSLTGKTLKIQVDKLLYSKAYGITSASQAIHNAAGADPHTHNLSWVSSEVTLAVAALENQGTIRIHYTVA